MGRHIKEGLSYFPLDTDIFEDEKIQFVSARFGVKGDGIIIRILCKLYRQGYALKYDDDVALLFARSAGDITPGLVNEVVNELLKRGFFDEALFKRFGLLTSKGIQKRYSKICTDAKRKDWEIEEKIDLLRNKPAFTPEEITKTPEESTQIKEKESKENKSKVLLGAVAPHTQADFEIFKKFELWINEKAPRVGKMKEPFTIEQYLKLKDKFEKNQVSDLLLKMHNWEPLLRKNRSAYLTLMNWSKIEEDRGTNTNHQKTNEQNSITNQLKEAAAKETID